MLNSNYSIIDFYGYPDDAFLAPRGVFIFGEKLIVSDTGKNRILIWKKMPTSKYQPADIVLENNIDKQVSDSSFHYPSGIWTNGKILMVADAWNHRVLIWHSFPTKSHQPADVVVGQKDFSQHQPNIVGVSANPNEHSLYWCYGVWSTGNDMWIADTGNRRILYFEKIPQHNFTSANRVIGQENFFEREYNPQHAIWPYSIKISNSGEMIVADTQYYRCLLWKDYKTAFTQFADVIIGQSDFEGNGANQYLLSPAAHTLNWCYDACFWEEKLLVADTGNSRVLIWNNIPQKNNMPADDLIGQKNFNINGESSLSMTNISLSNEMYWAFSVNSYQQKLAIADTGNNRILLTKK